MDKMTHTKGLENAKNQYRNGLLNAYAPRGIEKSKAIARAYFHWLEQFTREKSK